MHPLLLRIHLPTSSLCQRQRSDQPILVQQSQTNHLWLSRRRHGERAPTVLSVKPMRNKTLDLPDAASHAHVSRTTARCFEWSTALPTTMARKSGQRSFGSARNQPGPTTVHV
ncbi:hypothetical protein MRX96_049260 [Rhipicephalus microplus]